MKKVITALFLTLICSLPSIGLGADAPLKAAILPLDIHSREGLGYLREGLVDVFTSRLQVEGELAVVDKQVVAGHLESLKSGKPSLDELILLGGGLSADFLVYGSLTKLGRTISLDLRMLDVEAGLPVAYSSEVQGLDDLMAAVARMMGEIRARMLEGRPFAPPRQPAGQGRPYAAREDVLSVANRAAIAESVELFGAYEMSIGIRSMAVADVDNDGRDELVIVDDNGVFVYRVNAEGLVLVAEHKGEGGENFLRVGAADLNGNGFAEIFVTSERGRLRSFVLEWDGLGLKMVASDLAYFLEIVENPGEPARLFAQERSYGRWPFSGAIFELGYSEGQYLQVKREQGEGSLYHSLLSADVNGDGQVETLALGTDQRLALLTENGTTLSRSGDTYGGSCVHFEVDDDHGDDFTLQLEVPVAGAVRGLATEGRRQMLVAGNHAAGLASFGRKIKKYSSGKVYGLELSGRALVKKWASPEIEGCIAALRVADVTGDGSKELVVATGAGGSGLFEEPRGSVQLFRFISR